MAKFCCKQPPLFCGCNTQVTNLSRHWGPDRPGTISDSLFQLHAPYFSTAFLRSWQNKMYKKIVFEIHELSKRQERKTKTDRQTDKMTQTHWRTNKQTNERVDRQTNRQTKGRTDRQTGRQTKWHRCTEGQTNRQTDRWKDRQTARQTDTNKRTGRQTNNGYTRRTDRGQRDEVTDRLMEWLTD